MNNLLEQVYNQSFEDELIKISNRLSPEKYKALYDYNESVKKLIKPEYPYLHRAAIPLGLIGGAITGGAAGYGLSKLFKNPKLKVVSSVIGPGAGFIGGAAYGGMFGKKLVEKTPYYKKFTELGMKLQEDLNKQSAFKGQEIFKRLNPIRGKSPLSKILLNNKGGGFSNAS